MTKLRFCDILLTELTFLHKQGDNDMNFNKKRGIEETNQYAVQSTRRRDIRVAATTFVTSIALFISSGRSEIKAQTPDSVKSDRDTTLVYSDLMQQAIMTAEIVKSLPNMTVENRTNINETGRDVTYNTGRWNMVNEFSINGRPTETYMSSVHEPDENGKDVAVVVIDHIDGRLEDHQGNPLSYEDAKKTLKLTRQSAAETVNELQGAKAASTFAKDHGFLPELNDTNNTSQIARVVRQTSERTTTTTTRNSPISR